MRALSTALLAGVALALSSCGSIGFDDDKDDDFATYSPEQVQKRFQQLTGLELDETTLRGDALQSLRVEIEPGASSGYRRYSGVTVYVAGNEDALDSITDRSRVGDRRRFENVVVTSINNTDRGEEAYARMVRIMASLGKPASAARLAPEDTPCDRAGIDPESGDGKQGACLDEDEQKPVEVVNAGQDLEVDGLTVSDVKLVTGTRLTRRRFGSSDRQRATGRYAVVSYDLFNTGTSPLQSVRPGLVIDGKHFSEDTSAAISTDARDAFPIQPGGTARAFAVFDLPDASAGDVSQGALEVPVGSDGLPSSSVQFAEKVGRVRLESAGKGSRRVGQARLSG